MVTNWELILRTSDYLQVDDRCNCFQSASFYNFSGTFGNRGIQLQQNGTNPRFYVGNGSSKAFIFDGGNLHISSSGFTLDGA